MELRELEEYELEIEDIVIDKNPMATLFAKEQKWFMTGDKKLLGILLEDNIDKDWTYLILSKDEDEVFRAIDVNVSIEKEFDAQFKLNEAMSKIFSKGEKDETLFKLDEKISIEPINAIVKDIDEELKNYLKKNPEKLYELTPRKFEELIASILKDFGFDIELTKVTRDGGRDILAYMRNKVANYLTYVECKKYSPENKIDVSIIRQVIGVHSIHKPSKSIIVTTSSFTRDAILEAKTFQNQLELKDYTDIKNWLSKY